MRSQSRCFVYRGLPRRCGAGARLRRRSTHSDSTTTASSSSSNSSSSSSHANARLQGLAAGVRSKLPKSPKLPEVLRAVWEDPVITSQCPNLNIRLTSLRGSVAQFLWSQYGGQEADINVLAVGTTAIPSHLPAYRAALDSFYTETQRLAAEVHRAPRFDIGYDLLSQGDAGARAAVLTMFNRHYGMDAVALEAVSRNSAITSGGMRGLEDIAHACMLQAKADGTHHVFCQPDNSFGTWWNIIEAPVQGDANRRLIHTIATSPSAGLHLTAEDIHTHYSQHKPHTHESWYITPIGNPSGTAMAPSQLKENVEAILQHNKDAVIILDTVYLRTMTIQAANALMAPVVNNADAMQRIVWVESFSKSHGLCRERLGIYFSASDALFTRLHSANIAYSAGPGCHKDHQMLALGSASEDHLAAVESVHLFWRDERKALLTFLLGQPRFAHLVEPEQPHIHSRDIDQPCTLYILVKVKPGVNAFQLFVETGALGVDTQMGSGSYVRFSVGALLGPTYSA